MRNIRVKKRSASGHQLITSLTMNAATQASVAGLVADRSDLGPESITGGAALPVNADPRRLTKYWLT